MIKKIFNEVILLFKRRMVWLGVAVILFVVELTLLLGPLKWGGVQQVNWLSGLGAWDVAMVEGTPLCQEFCPEYPYLDKMSLLFQDYGQDVRGSSASVWIEDWWGNVVFQEEIPYELTTYGAYTNIEVGVTLKAKEKYYLKIECHPGESGILPAVSVCSMSDYMPENKMLYQTNEIHDAQLVTRYTYQKALTKENVIRIVGIAGLTALILGIGVPKNKYIRKGIAILGFLFAPLVLGRQLEFISLVIKEGVYIPGAMTWNVGIMYILQLVVLLCTQSLRFSVIFTNVALTIIYSADYFVRNYRSTPLKWNDFAAAGTAAQVVGEYDLTPSGRMAICWMLMILLSIIVLQTGVAKADRGFLYKGTWKRQLVLRAAGMLSGVTILLGTGYMLLNTDLLENQGFLVFHGFSESKMYQMNGYLVSFCMDYKTSRIVEPEGYSEEAIEEILEPYQVETSIPVEDNDSPHIILIMNESFSDLRALGNLELTEENMTNFYSLKEDTVRGTLNVSVIGGGTSNSEFEVFTGCTMGFFSGGYNPYLQCVSRPIDSLVTDLKDKGYAAYSMHPEDSANWNRNVVYSYLGFDKQYWIEDFENEEIIHNGVSDAATYRKIQELFENKEDGEKLFIFDVTMQNHGGYTDKLVWDDNYIVRGTNVNYPELELYLSLMKKSDESFGELIEYFREQDEKVIICMFGDHQPEFSNKRIYEKIFGQTEGRSEMEQELSKYVTPFVIWANYDIPEQDNINISTNYLSVLLQEAAQLELDPYFGYLKDLMKEYPVITSKGYRDAAGKFYEWNSEGTEFAEYRKLQYDRLFGK